MRKPVTGAVAGALALSASLLVAPAASAALQPDGPILLSGPQGHRLWNPVTGTTSEFPLETWQDPEAFSPDGARLAYVGGYDVDSAEIRVLGADGTDVLAGDVPGNQVGQVTFSGDGRRLAVWTTDYGQDGLNRIMVLSADGSQPPRVVLSDAGDPQLIEGAAWNPAAEEIAFIRNGMIGLVPADGGAVRDFTGECTWVDAEPDCSFDAELVPFSNVQFDPAGDRIVGQYNDPDTWDPAIGVLRRGTTAPTALFDVPVDQDGSYHIESAWFSPMGTRVIHTVHNDDDSGVADLLVRPAGGGAPTLSARGYGAVWQPCPDEECPVFGSPEREESTISLNYATTLRGIVRVNGQVVPNVGGQTVTVTLQQLARGSWRTVGRKTPSLSELSRYVVKFPRGTQFMCRLTASYPGDATRLPSSTTKKFSC